MNDLSHFWRSAVASLLLLAGVAPAEAAVVEGFPSFYSSTDVSWEGGQDPHSADDVIPVQADSVLIHPEGAEAGQGTAQAFSNPNALGVKVFAAGAYSEFSSFARAEFRDTLYFLELDGITPILTGTVLLTFAVDGTREILEESEILLEATIVNDRDSLVLAGDYQEPQTLPAPPTLDPVPYFASFTFGVDLLYGYLDVFYGLEAGVSNPHGGSASLDFLSTATLSSITFFRTGEDTPDTDILVLGASGASYSTESSPVPEPSSMLLCGLGLLTLGARQRRKFFNRT